MKNLNNLIQQNQNNINQSKHEKKKNKIKDDTFD